MAESVTTDTGSNLSDDFDSALDSVIQLEEDTDLETNSPTFQERVRKGISSLERLTTQLNELGVFSSNESFEEISSRDIKFLLTPALLGHLQSKRTISIIERLESVELSEIYYRDFLKRLKEYELPGLPPLPEVGEDDDHDKNSQSNGRPPSLEAMAKTRNDKITRYKEKTRLREVERELRQRLNRKDGTGEVDEEIIRKYYTSLLQKWVHIALDELDSIKLEKECLKRMASGPPPPREQPSSSSKKKSTFKPFILTRDAVAKKVFGLGYPSVPVMTVDEFVDEKQRDGTWAFDQHKKVYDNSLQNWAEDPDRKREEDEAENAGREELQEREDEKERRRQMAWDDFKDDTKRGEGNRYNRS